MRVKGIETSRREVAIEINPVEALEAIKQVVYDSLDIPITHDQLQVENGQLVTYEDERYGSHSSVERKVKLEHPTAKQLEVVQLFNDMKDVVFNHSQKF